MYTYVYGRRPRPGPPAGAGGFYLYHARKAAGTTLRAALPDGASLSFSFGSPPALRILRDAIATMQTEFTRTSAAAVHPRVAVRVLFWNMPYHAEHHAFPDVPFHHLPAVSRALRRPAAAVRAVPVPPWCRRHRWR